jgi:hypothetical protein
MYIEAQQPCCLQDRGIVPWLVQQPSNEECVRARKLKPAQMNRLETAWKMDPEATLEQVQVNSISLAFTVCSETQTRLILFHLQSFRSGSFVPAIHLLLTWQ